MLAVGHHSTSPSGRRLYKVIEEEEELYEVKRKHQKECSSRKGKAEEKREEHMNEKDMSTEANQSKVGEEVVTTKPGQTGWKQFQCPIADPRFPREDIKQIWKECQYESFWYRALPLSAGSMAVTGSLIYSGVWKKSKRFGYFPKLLLAGIVGYAGLVLLDLDLVAVNLDINTASMCVKSARKKKHKPQQQRLMHPLRAESL
ncbi:hypothetical protein QQF64_016905 [Cirrhinus molitorella]|uniref:OCIA domain-containing protein 1 n=1 Tax=Cirrhinus molitorella TaxID=172907 RepID=A0ABR3LP47_9TELE